MSNCIFCKIAAKEVPKHFSYEDNEIMVFPDIRPRKPVHLLIVPKTHIREFMNISDEMLFSKLMKVVQQMATENNLPGRGFQIIINGGGMQEINHLHIHLLGPTGTSGLKD